MMILKIFLASLLTLTALFWPVGTQAQIPKTLLLDLNTLASEQHLGRKSGAKTPNLSAEYIFARFDSMAAQPSYQPFTFPAGFFSQATGHNVIAKLPCTKQRCTDAVVLSAHYDGLGRHGKRHYPGANDNASGVAAMLNIAHNLSTQARARDFLFVATDAEERGLHGAKFYADTLDQKVAFNINLDMLAVNHRNRLFALLSPRFSDYESILKALPSPEIQLKVVSSTRQLARYSNNARINWHKASDHYAFYRQGIPYIYFGMGEDQHHHKISDSIDNIDINKYQASVELINRFIMLLAKPTEITD